MEAINKKNRLSIQIYSSAAPRPSLCPLELTEAEEVGIKKGGMGKGEPCAKRGRRRGKKRKGKASD